MTLKLILAFVIAFAVSAVVGFFLVPYLKRIKAGQSIKENGPTWHMSKQGTPTMGGLMFIAAIAVVCLSVGFDCMAEGEYGHLFCLAFALVFGAIGFLDDYEKLKKKQNLGLTAGKKILLQLAAAVAFIFLMRRFGYVALDSLYIPFWNTTVAISEPLYVIFAAFVIVGTVNSVNLTDGVDGLAAENLQARVRTVELMTIANSHGWLMLNCGNKSEAAMGFSTLYGDTAGAFAPIGDIYKTEVYELAQWRNTHNAVIPQSAIDKEPSAELYEGARDIDRLPPYDKLDELLEAHIEDEMGAAELIEAGFDPELVETVLKTVQANEYKRRSEPIAPHVLGRSFTRDRAWPITNGWVDPALA